MLSIFIRVTRLIIEDCDGQRGVHRRSKYAQFDVDDKRVSATVAALPVEELIASSINVNVTLRFSIERYQRVLE